MNGILLIDKPSDWTSSDVVAKLRGVLHEKRIGHAGTLDPLATGLLVLFVGRATRACSFAEAEDKEYRASLRLGLATDTQDVTGRVLRESDAAFVTEDALRAVLRDFEGELAQMGASVIIHANHLLRASYLAMRNVAECILEHERSQEADDLCLPIKDVLTLIPEE